MTDVNWARLLSALDQPAVGQVTEALADATDISISQAYDRVEAALERDDVPLIERDTGGVFPEVDPRVGRARTRAPRTGRPASPPTA